MTRKIGKVYIIVLALILVVGLSVQPVFSSGSKFNGEGTADNPYIISSFGDLKLLQELVNSGNDFSNCYFLQTTNIDMENIKWTPIGLISDNRYFGGIYNGGGHYIKNLYIDTDYAGLFGALGGTIANLGIESGNIKGTFSGSIANTIVGSSALIINCYNKASVNGYRAGGIVDSFSGGTVSNCWTNADLTGEKIGGIISSGGDVKLYSCFTTNPIIAPEDVISSTSYTIDEGYLMSRKFADRFSIYTALAQYLFADFHTLKLLQWDYVDNDLQFSEKTQYINLIGFVNFYLLPVILILIILILIIKVKCIGIDNFIAKFKASIFATSLITGILSFFMDTALASKGFRYINWGNGLFIVLINIIFIISCIFSARFIKSKNVKFQRRWIPLLILILFVITIELLQFDIVPKYDAALYYGSLVKGTSTFRFDLLSFIGSFVCWKWAHGLSLLMAPWEFLFPGQIISIYITNILISIITLCCLYWLLRNIYKNISNFGVISCCIIFVFSPYMIGLFTYLCMDWHLAFFSVWLLCSIQKKNNILISFCGFLLAFTKITGLIFYVFVLLIMFVLEIYQDKGCSIVKRIIHWWDWSKIFLWVLPAVLFGITLLYGDHLTIQNFYGSPAGTQSMINFNYLPRIIITLLQTFIYGFRWIFTLGLLVSFFIILKRIKKNRVAGIIIENNLIVSTVLSFLCVLIMLCIYNGDAECPRYTAIFGLLFVLILPFCADIIFKKNRSKKLALIVISVLLIVQTFWTIDPSIFILNDSINTGKKSVYRLALSIDDRPGMNLGKDYGPGHPVMCDLYAYNLEYSFYDDLIQKTFLKIQPQKEDIFYVLDIFEYELHISGSANRNYKIYWNTRQQRRTYDSVDKDSIYLNVSSITSEYLKQENLNLPDTFYLIVVDRVDESISLESVKNSGYTILDEIHPENIYGQLSVYKLQKRDNINMVD